MLSARRCNFSGKRPPSPVLFLGFLAILAGNAAEEERRRAENNVVVIRVR